MFRSVQMDLACQRCGSSCRAEVQFKTGDDRCEGYALGDHVDDLPVGEEWEGIADRFCAPCWEDHRAERERAMATIMAELVRAGRIELKLAEAEVPLTAEEILQRGEEKSRVARQGLAWFGTPLVLADLWFRNERGAWLPTTEMRERWPPLHRALNEEMRHRGWPFGDDIFREDLIVGLDQDRRIRVRPA